MSQNGFPATSPYAGADARQRRRIRVNDIALEIQQALILVAGLEDGAHLRFAGLKLRGALPDALLQRFVETAKLGFGFLRDRHIVGDPDKADMFSGGSQRGCDSDRIHLHCPSARR